MVHSKPVFEHDSQEKKRSFIEATFAKRNYSNQFDKISQMEDYSDLMTALKLLILYFSIMEQGSTKLNTLT